MAAWFVLIDPRIAALDGLPILAGLCIDVAIGAFIYIAAMYVLWRLEGRPGGVERHIAAALSALRKRIARN